MCSILWSMYPPPWPSCKLFILFTGYCLFKEPIRCKVDASVTSTYGNRPYLLSAHLYIISRINSIFIRWLLLMKTSCMQRVVKFNRTTISTPKSIAAQVLGILVAFTCCRLTLGLQAFRHVFWNQFNHRHFQMVIWSTTEIIFPVHCIYTIFSGLVSRDIRASTWWIDISRIKFQYL